MSKAIVIGGGLGGLATGIALRRVGWEVAVYEQAPGPRTEGESISLWSRGIGLLAGLGVRPAGQQVDRIVLQHPAGGALELDLRPMAARLGYPNLTIRRAALLADLTEALGDGRLHYGMTCISAENTDGGAIAKFADGSGFVADLVVAADGVHSPVRSGLWGDRSRFVGTATWQGAVCAEVEQPTPDTVAAVATGGLFGGVFRMPDGRTHWFVDHHQSSPDRPADGHRRLRSACGDWPGPFPYLVSSTPPEELHFVPIYVRKPPRHWYAGRVVLIGDAAHAMGPALGQGASQAFADAVALAGSCAGGTAVEAGLRRYESRRRGEARRLWLASQAALMGRRLPVPDRVPRVLLRPWLSPLATRVFQASVGGGRR